MKTNCITTKDIFLLTEGAIDNEKARDIQTHLDHCFTCRKHLTEFVHLKTRMKLIAPSLERQIASDPARYRIRQKLLPAKKQPQKLIFGRAGLRLAAAVSFGIAIVIAVIYTRFQFTSRLNTKTPLKNVVYSEIIDSIDKEIKLSDTSIYIDFLGETVILDAETPARPKPVIEKYRDIVFNVVYGYLDRLVIEAMDNQNFARAWQTASHDEKQKMRENLLTAEVPKYMSLFIKTEPAEAGRSL